MAKWHDERVLELKSLRVIHLTHHQWLYLDEIIHVVTKEAGHRHLSYLLQLQCNQNALRFGGFHIYDFRPHSERFCDIALKVKFYYECDVAKSLRMGPLVLRREADLEHRQPSSFRKKRNCEQCADDQTRTSQVSSDSGGP